MDTLFRLVSLQSDQSYNSSRTSSSSRSSKQNNTHHHHVHQEEECSYLFMDEDDFSSSSSKHHFFPPPPLHHPLTYTSAAPTPQPSSSSSSSLDHLISSASGPNWAADLLTDCARAIADSNSGRAHHLMWMLNEMSSPYGDTHQKLASYFLHALFSRMTDSGPRSLRALLSASDKTSSFDSTRKTLLKFQEVSPWTTFGHVAANGAILEAFDGETKLHILDASTTFCTQWPTLLEALATRSSDDTPHLRLTTLVATRPTTTTTSPSPRYKLMKEVGARMEKFARLMGVPFSFRVHYHAGDLSQINFDDLDIRDDEALAINCVGTLHSVPPVASSRDALLAAFRRLRPRILTVVEDEADLEDSGAGGDDFVRAFRESLRWFAVYFEALDESFPRASNERLVLERAAGRAIVDLVACLPAESAERRETAARWSRRFDAAGFSPAAFSDDVADDVRALLRRYRDGWSMAPAADGAGLFLAWKEQPVVWACAWKP